MIMIELGTFLNQFKAVLLTHSHLEMTEPQRNNCGTFEVSK